MHPHIHFTQFILNSLNFQQFLQGKGEYFYVFLGLPVPICITTFSLVLFIIQELLLITWIYYCKSYKEGLYVDGLLSVLGGATLSKLYHLRLHFKSSGSLLSHYAIISGQLTFDVAAVIFSLRQVINTGKQLSYSLA